MKYGGIELSARVVVTLKSVGITPREVRDDVSYVRAGELEADDLLHMYLAACDDACHEDDWREYVEVVAAVAGKVVT